MIIINKLLPFLWIGHIFDFFQISGNILWLIQLLKMIVSGFTIAESQHSNGNIIVTAGLIDIKWSYITKILVLKFNWQQFSICYIRLSFNFGIAIEVCTLWCKKIIKIILFYSKSGINLLLIWTGGIISTFSPL